MRIHTNVRLECPGCGVNLGYYCYSDYSVGIPAGVELTEKECLCALTEEQYAELDNLAWRVYTSGE